MADRVDAGRYRGTVALGARVPDWPWKLGLTALDVWEGCVSLRGTGAFEPLDPFRWPKPAVSTNTTAHQPCGGGAHGSNPTYHHWEFTPTLPDDATEIQFVVGNREERQADGAPRPHAQTFVVELSGWPLTPRRTAFTVLNSAVPRGMSAAVKLPQNRPPLPDYVIAVSAQLDDVDGHDICVLSLETWSSCFDLHLAGCRLYEGCSTSRSPEGWAAEDNVGGHYVGRYRGGHCGPTSNDDVSFMPALDPAASQLQLDFPSPFDATSLIRTTIELDANR